MIDRLARSPIDRLVWSPIVCLSWAPAESSTVEHYVEVGLFFPPNSQLRCGQDNRIQIRTTNY